MPRISFLSGRKSLLLLAVVAVIIGGAWWWQSPPPEPVWNGQRLSDWLATYGEMEGFVTPPYEQLHAFGPSAVPWLAYTAEYGRHPFTRHGPLPFDKAPDWLRRCLPARWGGLRPAASRNDRVNALLGLIALGPEAAPAIPSLARVIERELEGDEDDSVRGFAAMALGKLENHEKRPIAPARVSLP
jgi:hypothetical protein